MNKLPITLRLPLEAAQLLIDELNDSGQHSVAADVYAQARMLLPPFNEPPGFGAVVKCSDGSIHMRVYDNTETHPWRCIVGPGTRHGNRSWYVLSTQVVEILSLGVNEDEW